MKFHIQKNDNICFRYNKYENHATIYLNYQIIISCELPETFQKLILLPTIKCFECNQISIKDQNNQHSAEYKDILLDMIEDLEGKNKNYVTLN